MDAEQFTEFFAALHGQPPFPWQARLARQLCERGKWPAVLDLPTGSGKTACIDIGLFHFLSAVAKGKATAAARRIVFVVDRRVIVDEARRRALEIRERLRAAEDGILRRAGDLLLAATGQADFDVHTLRGGAPREKNLVRDPLHCAMVLSTVDQIGSRLLFRGYGISPRAAPMHAGQFGHDTLLLLDEAHIAGPFLQTLHGIRRLQARASESLGVQPLSVVQLSATPTGGADFQLDAADQAHPVLARRLTAPKPMRLLEVARRENLPKLILEQVESALAANVDADEAPRIGVIVNRVATAREVLELLRKRLKDRVDSALIIGPVRPLDRDVQLQRLEPLLKSSARPRPGDRPIVVVATQTIEVGADFDFHVLLTEAAGYAALRQRVGRLNRLGNRATASGAIVLVRDKADADPIYGAALLGTWSRLATHAVDGAVDLGIDRAPPPSAGCLLPETAAPQLLPAHLALLEQTWPRPGWEPEVASYLHGFQRTATDVGVVWRDGLGAGPDFDESLIRALLDALPPLSLETLQVPLPALTGWLRGRGAARPPKPPAVADIESLVDEGEDAEASPLLVPVYDAGGLRLVGLDALRPGQTLVLPSEWGGADAEGLNWSSTQVDELAWESRERAGHSAVLVWTSDRARRWLRPDADPAAWQAACAALLDFDAETADLDEAWANWVAASGELLEPRWSARLAGDWQAPEAVHDRDGRLLAVILRARRVAAADFADEDGALQFTREVGLDAHGRGVAAYCERYARTLQLPEPLQRALVLAGRLHDIGKADPRFQAMLGGRPDRLLAKGRVSRRARRAAGARHECYSVALLDAHPQLLGDADAELVRYLIGTHHGVGRGLQPFVEDDGVRFALEVDGQRLVHDGAAELHSLHHGWAEYLPSLSARFGPWGLAYLETLLRLADHRRSEAELDLAEDSP